MSLSQTEICNLALTFIGGSRISSLDDDSKEALICKLSWDIALDEVLVAHPWGFSTARASLARLSDEPVFEWSYQYLLPSDCLRVVRVNGDYAYSVESYDDGASGYNKILLSNQKEVNALYIRKVDNVAMFPAYFVTALAYRLASQLAFTLSDDDGMADYMMQAYVKYLQNGRALDSQEGGAHENEGPASKNTYWVDKR